jgi:hypothetical protein
MSRGPGRLQQAILEQLARSESFSLLELIRRGLGHEPDHTERVNWYAAAKGLETNKQCRIVMESQLDRRGRQQKQAVVYRPHIAPEPKPDAAYLLEAAQPERIRIIYLEEVGSRSRHTAPDDDTSESAHAWLVGHMRFADPVNWAQKGSRLPAHVPDADYYEYYSDSLDLVHDDDREELNEEPFTGPFKPTLVDYY